MVDIEVLRKVQKYLDEVRSKGVSVSRVFIYGSHARGTATEESDIDVMLISPLFDANTDKYAPALWGGELRSEYKIEPYAVGEQRFLTDEYSPLIAVVKAEGIEIAA